MIAVRPSLEEFQEIASSRRVISVYAKILADDLTPVALYHALCGTREGTYLLESADAGVFSRYSIVGVRAEATLTEVDGRAVWLGRELVGIEDGDPLEVLRRTLDELATPADAELPPFHAGMVGYLGYDVVRRLERLPETTVDDLRLPELTLLLASGARGAGPPQGRTLADRQRHQLRRHGRGRRASLRSRRRRHPGHGR